MEKKKNRVWEFIKRETVFAAAIAAAVISAFFVPPGAAYLAYPDYRVLALLFCLMIIVAGIKEQGIFTLLGEKLAERAGNSRQLSLLLVLLCFFSGMLITNDVALLTFVPFALELLTLSGCKDKIIKVVVLQTIAANLGSMFTPVGNPQNLYLYTLTGMSLTEFLLWMLPLSLLSLVLLLVALGVERPVPVQLNRREERRLPEKKKVLCLAALFVLCLLTVIRLVPWQIVFLLTAAGIFFLDRSLFQKVDYCLLGTFLGFFVFVGNMQNIASVREMLERLLLGREMGVSVAASQIISNVPAAMLLSGFTRNYKALLYGVNIGGLGTLIASLASVISYKCYGGLADARKGRYLLSFTLWNLLFLAVLLLGGFLLLPE